MYVTRKWREGIAGKEGTREGKEKKRKNHVLFYAPPTQTYTHTCTQILMIARIHTHTCTHMCMPPTYTHAHMRAHTHTMKAEELLERKKKSRGRKEGNKEAWQGREGEQSTEIDTHKMSQQNPCKPGHGGTCH